MKTLILVTLLMFSLLSPTCFAGDEVAASLVRRDDVSASDLAAVMGIYIWKFDAPVDGKYRIELSLRDGVVNSSLARLEGIRPATMGPVPLIVAIVPINGTINTADQLRVTINLGDINYSVANNPFKTLGVGASGGKLERQTDGSYVLLGGFRGNTVSTPTSKADLVLSLKLSKN